MHPSHQQITPLSFPDRRISIKVVLPQRQNLPERRITVHVPSSVVQEDQLRSMFTGPIIDTAIRVPAPQAASLLQQYVDQTFDKII